MTPEQFELAIYHLAADGLALPHGFIPGTEPGGVRPIADQAAWDFYQWNPPEHLVGVAGFEDYQEADPAAGVKPTWAAIEAALAAAAPVEAREEIATALRAECRRRITAAYGADDWQDEIEKRVGGRATEAQHAERERLRAKHAALEAGLADMALAALEAFTPTADAHWAADEEDDEDGE